MTPVFVMTLGDIVGLSILALFLLAAAFFYVAIKIENWWKKRNGPTDQEGK